MFVAFLTRDNIYFKRQHSQKADLRLGGAG